MSSIWWRRFRVCRQIIAMASREGSPGDLFDLNTFLGSCATQLPEFVVWMKRSSAKQKFSSAESWPSSTIFLSTWRRKALKYARVPTQIPTHGQLNSRTLCTRMLCVREWTKNVIRMNIIRLNRSCRARPDFFVNHLPLQRYGIHHIFDARYKTHIYTGSYNIYICSIIL